MNPRRTNKAAGSETSTQHRTLVSCRSQPEVLLDSQPEVLLDLLRSAVERDAWLTLDEMAGETKLPPASISAQLRHLRKPQYGPGPLSASNERGRPLNSCGNTGWAVSATEGREVKEKKQRGR